jgi:hypothetical protein
LILAGQDDGDPFQHFFGANQIGYSFACKRQRAVCALRAASRISQDAKANQIVNGQEIRYSVPTHQSSTGKFANRKGR